MAWKPDYCEVVDLAEFVRITDTNDDAQLARAISAASRAVDRTCGRQFGLVAAPETRVYEASYDRKLCAWFVSIDDLMTEVGLVVAGDYTLYPRNAVLKGEPRTRLVLATAPGTLEVEVTARWGWSSVPVPVVEATLLQASRLFARRGAPFGIAGSPADNSEMRLLAKVDPDVAVSLGDFQRRWAAV